MLALRDKGQPLMVGSPRFAGQGTRIRTYSHVAVRMTVKLRDDSPRKVLLSLEPCDLLPRGHFVQHVCIPDRETRT